MTTLGPDFRKSAVEDYGARHNSNAIGSNTHLSEARLRFIHHYLERTRAETDNLSLFTENWPQVDRAWHGLLQEYDKQPPPWRTTMIDYLLTFFPLQHRCGLWREASDWNTAALPHLAADETTWVKVEVLAQLGLVSGQLGNHAMEILCYDEGLEFGE